MSQTDEILTIDLRGTPFPSTEPFRKILAAVPPEKMLHNKNVAFHLSRTNLFMAMHHLIAADFGMHTDLGISRSDITLYGIPIYENPNNFNMDDSRIILTRREVTHDPDNMEVTIRDRILAVGHLTIIHVTHFKACRKLKL